MCMCVFVVVLQGSVGRQYVCTSRRARLEHSWSCLHCSYACCVIPIVSLRGIRGSFEVFVDDKPLFSRLLKGDYPHIESLVEVRVVRPGRVTTDYTHGVLLLLHWQGIEEYVKMGRLPARVITEGTSACSVL